MTIESQPGYVPMVGFFDCAYGMAFNRRIVAEWHEMPSLSRAIDGLAALMAAESVAEEDKARLADRAREVVGEFGRNSDNYILPIIADDCRKAAEKLIELAA